MPKQKSNKVEAEAEIQGEPQSIILLPPNEEPEPLRAVGLIGDVTEEKAGEIIQSLLTIRQYGKIEKDEQAKTKNSKTKTKEYQPFEFYISTHGGSASDMFAIYDIMRQVKKDCDISTIGVGKVMSAGVLLLAAGTKGKRKIGKNCRVMIHSVNGGNQGPIHDLENEMEEIRWVQERYISSLIEESKLTKKAMSDLLKKHVNVYLSAEEAVKYGIADEVI